MVFGVLGIFGVSGKQLEPLILEDSGFYDVYGIAHRPWWQHPGWKFLLGGVLVLALFVLVMRWYRQRKKAKMIASWTRAFQDIAQLKDRILASNPISQETGSAFYVEISKIIKNYMLAITGNDVLGATDQELIAWARDMRRFPPEVQEMVTQVLSGGEYIKFAGQQALRETIEHHAQLSIEIVKKTMPQGDGK